jgi:hypothetical protein
MEKQFCFNYEHYAALAELSDADRELVREAERATANANAPYSKFRVGAAAQRENPLRKQFRERGLSRGALRRADADVLCAGQLCRRSDRDAGDRFRSLGARMLSLRPVPSGDGGRRTPSGRAHAGGYERRRHGDGRRFGGAAAALHVRALIRSEHIRDTGFGGAARRRRGNVALKYRPLLEIPEKCSLPKISSTKTIIC